MSWLMGDWFVCLLGEWAPGYTSLAAAMSPYRIMAMLDRHGPPSPPTIHKNTYMHGMLHPAAHAPTTPHIQFHSPPALLFLIASTPASPIACGCDGIHGTCAKVR